MLMLNRLRLPLLIANSKLSSKPTSNLEEIQIKKDDLARGHLFSIFNTMRYILLIGILFLMSCSETTTQPPVNDCMATSDTTVVCSDVQYQRY